MPQVLLDTSTLSEIIKGQNASVSSHAQQYLAAYQQFSFSILTRYEILRGLEAIGATSQIIRFHQRCTRSNVLPLTDDIVVIASRIYADLYRAGQLISDADVLIAATAQFHNLDLVSENVRNFERVPGLTVTSWR